MNRKTISRLALTALAALLATGLAFAADPTAPEPAVAPAAPEETAPQPALPDLADLLAGGSCEPQPTARIPGCSVLCKADRDCPHYPEQVCTQNGCCVY